MLISMVTFSADQSSWIRILIFRMDTDKEEIENLKLTSSANKFMVAWIICFFKNASVEV
jgi:hypothetical protein